MVELKKVPVEAFNETLKMFADGLEEMIKRHQGEAGFDRLFFKGIVYERDNIMMGFCLGLETVGLIDKEVYQCWVNESTRTFNSVVDKYFS